MVPFALQLSAATFSVIPAFLSSLVTSRADENFVSAKREIYGNGLPRGK